LTLREYKKLRMKITVFPACNGDSFILETEVSIVLIDGGYVDTYKKFIKPKLLKLKEDKKELFHVIVTHIDNDHISGIIKFIEENKTNELINIDFIWHNSYNQIKDIDDGLIFKGKPISELTINYVIKEEIYTNNKNISAVQGSTLASLLKKHNYNCNTQFKNNLVSTDSEMEVISNDITFKILSPNNDKLKELKKYWKKELYKKGFSSDENLEDFNEDAFEYILSLEKEKKRLAKKNVSSSSSIIIDDLVKDDFIEDDTATNGSSIAFILENKEHKFLFLADSHPSIIVQNLKKYYKEDEFPVKFDLIKIAHHGSKSNTSPELLNLIDSEKYVFSTNGLIHNHPDKETIARIISRPSEFTRNLYFNYPLEILNDFKDEKMTEKYNFKIIETSDDKSIELNF
jgi:beta-lactamase superfamily II metal-dependent hydrolase